MFASGFGTFIVISLCSAAKLPETFELCKIDAPDAQTCLTRAFQNSFTLLKDGLPELGVLPIDPLEISELTVSQGEGAVSMTLTMTNVVATGFKDVQVISSAQEELKPGSANMVSEVLVPDLKLIADYKIDGRILVLPIKGQGRCNFTLTNVHVKSRLENEIITVDGENYIRVNKFMMNTNPEEIRMHLEGLFGGDVRLGEEMNKFLNANSKTVYGELKPAIEETFGEVFKEISNKIFLQVPHKSIFLRD